MVSKTVVELAMAPRPPCGALSHVATSSALQLLCESSWPFWATCGMGLGVEQRTSRSPAGHRPARVRGRVLGAPDKAPSDGPNMVKLTELKKLLTKLIEIDKIIKV